MRLSILVSILVIVLSGCASKKGVEELAERVETSVATTQGTESCLVAQAIEIDILKESNKDLKNRLKYLHIYIQKLDYYTGAGYGALEQRLTKLDGGVDIESVPPPIEE
jgi:hypothetical protein